MAFNSKSLAIVGGGPGGLYALKEYIRYAAPGSTVYIISPDDIGCSLPWSAPSAGKEHLSNIEPSGIPPLMIPLWDWLQQQPDDWFTAQGLCKNEITDQTFFPRVTDGAYFNGQFAALREWAERRGIKVEHIRGQVIDCEDVPQQQKFNIIIDSANGQRCLTVDWQLQAMGGYFPADPAVHNYYESPWPISKLNNIYNCPVGLLGSSLSAVDVAVTAALQHGAFEQRNDELCYTPNAGTDNFKLTMYSRRGFLPHLRHYYEYPDMAVYRAIDKASLEKHIRKNNGFLALDFMFENVFKHNLRQHDPVFYEAVKDLDMEGFIAWQTAERHSHDPWQLMAAELVEGKESLAHKRPVFWKELLDDTIYTISFYGRYLAAEDMIRFQETLNPFFAYISAFMPHLSAERLMALHAAGKLDVVAVGDELSITTNRSRPGASLRYYNKQGQRIDVAHPVFVKCVGQKTRPMAHYPFFSLVEQGILSPAVLKFASPEAAQLERKTQADKISYRDGQAYYHVGGLAVDDYFRPLDANCQAHPRMAIISAGDIGGQHPVYTGLPSVAEAARRAVAGLFNRPLLEPDHAMDGPPLDTLIL